MRPLILKLLVGFIGTAGLGYGSYHLYGLQGRRHEVRKPPGYPVSPAEQVHVLGWIQPEGGIVEVAGTTGLRVLRLGEGVAEGRDVTKEQVLAYLEGYEEHCRELGVIDAQIAEAEDALRDEAADEAAALKEIDAAARRAHDLGELKLEELRLRVGQIERECDFARAQLKALDGLQHDHTIAPADYDKQRAALERAEGELAAARAERRRATEEFRQATGASKLEEQRRQVRAAARRAAEAIPIRSLKKKRELTEALIERAIIRAPRAGQILEVAVRPGEALARGPVVKLAPRGPMYVVAEVFEDERRRVAPGQAATAECRGLPGSGPLRGTVDRVGRLVGGRKLLPLDPTADAASHVFDVWIRLDEESSGRVRDYSLMNVDVAIAVAAERPPGAED